MQLHYKCEITNRFKYITYTFQYKLYYIQQHTLIILQDNRSSYVSESKFS